MQGDGFSLTSPSRDRVRAVVIGACVFALLVAVFLLSPWSGGDDWILFRRVAERALDGKPLYGSPVYRDAHYYNPPWIATLFIPATVIPARFGWAIASAVSLVASVLLLQRWQPKPGYLKPVLVMLSPATIYIILHGQIDLLVLCGIFLPPQGWGVVALAKPQVAIGLSMGIPRRLWIQAALIVGVMLVLSLVFFGNWVSDLYAQENTLGIEGHNIWRGLWPFQLPAGVFLLVLGISRKDERFLVAGSPIVAPYAATSSLIGPWIAAITFLKDWQALAVFASWWGAVILRGLS